MWQYKSKAKKCRNSGLCSQGYNCRLRIFASLDAAEQVSEDNWWDMDAAALDDRTLAKLQEPRDWNA